MKRVSGLVSWFGGPEDGGVSASEDLALYWENDQIDLHPELFLPEQPPNTTGTARRLNPESRYVAMRWNYDEHSKDFLRDSLVLIYAPKTDRAFLARPVDWGPADDAGGGGRVADISSGLLEELGITTDDEVEIIGPFSEAPKQHGWAVAISSGHSTKCQGAEGIINEVEEATRVVDAVGRILNARGIDAYTYSDTVSNDQSENLNRIVDWHNSLGDDRQLDVSVHFNNAGDERTDKAYGTECLYLTQESLAREISAAISQASGLIDRGPKYRDDLFVINKTDKPCVLIEICFVESRPDVSAYESSFRKICLAIANVIGRHGDELVS